MKRIVLALLLLGALTCGAQTSGKQEKPASSAADITGMYTFLREGEFVQINVEEENRVTGFVSRYSDSGQDIFLDHFFSKAALRDRELSFTTKVVHGVWFEFKGRVQRGEAKSRALEGYYTITGALTQYDTDAQKKVSAKTREVTFKSFPQEAEEEQPRK